jgi:hypothetical protein
LPCHRLRARRIEARRTRKINGHTPDIAINVETARELKVGSQA